MIRHFKIMNKLKEDLLVGEFVDYKLDYTIQECEIRESTKDKKEDKKIEGEIICECGASITKKSFLRHKSSLKHAYFELKRDYEKLLHGETFEIDNPLLEKKDIKRYFQIHK